MNVNKLNARFTATELALARKEAKLRQVRIPKHLTALKNSVGRWFLVEGDGGFKYEVCADSALDARVKAIEYLVAGKILSNLEPKPSFQ